MGGSLSAKYESINHDFDISVWKVHDAISKSSGKHVSLWMIDYQLMKQRDRNKKVRRRYLQHCQNAIQIQQKISHRNVLKILEYDSAGKKFGFASEKIVCALSNETKYSRDEAMYITQQLAITLDYLHENHKIVFQGLCPDNVFLSPSFTIKLGLFLHAAPYQTDIAPIQHPFMPWQPNSIYFVPANYCAPEIVTGSQPITVSVDVYMFALLVIYVFTGRPPSEATGASDLDVSLPLAACQDLPEEYSLLLKSCLNTVPASRPSFQTIVNDEAFSSLVCSIFKYLEIIATKDPKDLFNFFSGLKKYLNVFSFRIIRQKFMPVFIYFIKKDVRYGIALLPMILKIHTKFNDQQFLEDVVMPLRPIFNVTEPTVIPGIFVDHLAIFINRIPPQKYEEFVYPIIINALKVNSRSVVEKVLKVLPYVVSIMSTEVLKTELMPIMKKVIENLQSPETAQSFLEIIILTMKKTGPVFIAEEAIPSIRSLWFRTNFVQITEKITDLLILMTVPVEILASTSIPTAASILANPKVPLYTQARLIEFVRKSLFRLQNERQISAEDIEAASSLKVKEYNFPTGHLEFKDSDDEGEGEEEEEEYKENENYSYEEDEADGKSHDQSDEVSDSSKSSKSRSKSFDPKQQQQLINEEIQPNLRGRRKTTPVGALAQTVPVNNNSSPNSNNNSNSNNSNSGSQFPSATFSNHTNSYNEKNQMKNQQLPTYQNGIPNKQFDMRRFSLTEKKLQNQLYIPPNAQKGANCSSGNELEELQLSSISNPPPTNNISNRPRNKTFSQTQPIRTSQPFLPEINLGSIQRQNQANPSSLMNQSRSQSQFDIFPKHDEQKQQNLPNQPKFNFSDASPSNSPRAANSSGHNPFVQLNFGQITDTNSNQHASTARSSEKNPFSRADSKSNQSNESSSSTAIGLSPNDQTSPRRSVIFDQQHSVTDPFAQQQPPPSKHPNQTQPKQQQQQPPQPQQGGINLDMEDPFAAALAQRQNNPTSDQFQIFNQQKAQENPFNTVGSKSNPFNSSANVNQTQLKSPFSSTNNVRNKDGFEFEFDQ